MRDEIPCVINKELIEAEAKVQPGIDDQERGHRRSCEFQRHHAEGFPHCCAFPQRSASTRETGRGSIGLQIWLIRRRVPVPASIPVPPCIRVLLALPVRPARQSVRLPLRQIEVLPLGIMIARQRRERHRCRGEGAAKHC
jgi:hypothetical protein